MKYSDQQLTLFNVRDLINDYRCTRRDIESGEAAKYHDETAIAGLARYAEECRQRAIAIFKARRKASIGKFGETVIKPE